MVYALSGIYQASGRLVEVNALAKREALSRRQRAIALVLSYALLGTMLRPGVEHARVARVPDRPGPGSWRSVLPDRAEVDTRTLGDRCARCSGISAPRPQECP
jgi:hypothetical protein